MAVTAAVSFCALDCETKVNNPQANTTAATAAATIVAAYDLASNRRIASDALRRRDSDRLPRSRKSCSNPLEKNQVGKEEVSCRSLLFLGGVSLLALIAFVFGFLQIFVYTRRRCSSLRSLNLQRSLRLTPGPLR